MSKLIPVYSPFRAPKSSEYVLDCIQTNWISSKGAYLDRFQSELAASLGGTDVALVSNGTTALHLALIAAGIGPGDEVLCPVLTYVATANAIKYVGATPVFVDVSPITWTIDTQDLQRYITKRTKAVMAVHLYGVPCEMSKLCLFAREFGLKVIEDCAESFGSSFQGSPTGTIGDFGTFSFFGNKTITTGEGGAVTCRRASDLDLVNNLKNQGIHPSRKYYHKRLGYNYRMTNIQAALGCAQMDSLPVILSRKKKLHETYKEHLSQKYVFQSSYSGCKVVNWMTVILCPSMSDRKRLISEFQRNNIEIRPVFPLLNRFPHLRTDGHFQHAERVSKLGLNLPSGPNMTKLDISRILGAIFS